MPAATDAARLDGWLRDAAAQLGRAGLDSPRTEAEQLAAHALGCTWSELWARLPEALDVDARRVLRAALGRRLAGEPLAYVLGTVVFHGLEMACGPGVLVPRPETEVLVDVLLELVEDTVDPVVVDVGTGTGAIALAVAAHRPDATLIATDMSGRALRYARRNAERLRLPVRFVLADLMSPFAAVPATLDAVVSNPPYVPSGRPDLVAADVRAEPPEALFAGPRGDEVMLRLAGYGETCLRPGGVFVCEVGTRQQADALRARLSGWAACGVRDDLAGRPRAVWARRPA